MNYSAPPDDHFLIHYLRCDPYLTRVTDQEATPNVLADFRYDALGRRIEKLARCGGVAPGTTTRYYLDGQRIVEETGTDRILMVHAVTVRGRRNEKGVSVHSL